MSNLKRILASVLSLVVLTVAVAACQSSASPSGPGESTSESGAPMASPTSSY